MHLELKHLFFRTISANSNNKATQTVVGSSPTVSIRQKCHKCIRKTHTANSKKDKAKLYKFSEVVQIHKNEVS